MKTKTNQLNSNFKRQGIWEEAFTIANFNNGEKHGLCKFYSLNGEHYFSANYVNDIQEGEELQFKDPK